MSCRSLALWSLETSLDKRDNLESHRNPAFLWPCAHLLSGLHLFLSPPTLLHTGFHFNILFPSRPPLPNTHTFVLGNSKIFNDGELMMLPISPILREGGLVFYYKPYASPILTRISYFIIKGPFAPEKNLTTSFQNFHHKLADSNK